MAKKVFAISQFFVVRWLTAKRELAPLNELIGKNLTAPLFAVC